jgi:hypothetical protein
MTQPPYDPDRQYTQDPWAQPPPSPPPLQGQPYPQSSGQHIYIQQPDNSNNTSLAPVTSLITGLLGIFTAWIPIVGVVGWIFGPLALIFGILGLKRGKAEHKIMSIIGIVAGAITLLICLGYALFFIIAAIGSAGSN